MVVTRVIGTLLVQLRGARAWRFVTELFLDVVIVNFSMPMVNRSRNIKAEVAKGREEFAVTIWN